MEKWKNFRWISYLAIPGTLLKYYSASNFNLHEEMPLVHYRRVVHAPRGWLAGEGKYLITKEMPQIPDHPHIPYPHHP